MMWGFLIVVFVSASLLSGSVAQFSSPCRASGSCCYVLDFENTLGNNGQALSPGYDFSAQQPYRYASVNVTTPTLRPGTTSWTYGLTLLDTTAVKPTDDWHELATTTQGLILVDAATLNLPIRPLQGNFEQNVYFTDPMHPGCIEQLTLVRTTGINYRTSVSFTLYGSNGVLFQRWYPWSLTLRDNVLTIPLSISGVTRVQIQFAGTGYGGLASISGCYARASLDACGVCNGDGSMCAGQPVPTLAPGSTCYNTSMSNTVCVQGRISGVDGRTCIPLLFNLTREICNGVDDDCDGVIDNGVTAVNSTTCGVGACQRVLVQCNGAPYTPNAVCVPGAPVSETCNGIDDDCDGVIDNGNVCAQPVQGVAIAPVATCVEGRLQADATQCYAHFGYRNQDLTFAVTRPYGTDLNALSVVPPPVDPNVLANLSAVIPSTFAAGVTVSDGFRVPIDCQDGAAVWSLGDGQGNYLRAIVYAHTAVPCETMVYLNATSAPIRRPISVLVDWPCVNRTGSVCTVGMGYYNPNLEAPVYYLPSSVNTLIGPLITPSGGGGGGPPPVAPQSFFTQRVREALVLQWSCPLGTETVTWQLQTAGTIRSAQASAKDAC